MAEQNSSRPDTSSTPGSPIASPDPVYTKSHEVRFSTVTVSSLGSSFTRRTSNDSYEDALRSNTSLGVGAKAFDYHPQHSEATASPPHLQTGHSHDTGTVPTLKTLTTPYRPLWRVWKSYWHDTWFAEVLSCCCAVICLGAIVITLSMHQGKTLPRWPLDISINALLAVFTAILKATLALPLTEGVSQLKWQWFSQRPRALVDLDRFDSASRGAWGASWFLVSSNAERFGTVWRRPWRYPGLLLQRSGYDFFSFNRIGT